jgi:hypothetical protein
MLAENNLPCLPARPLGTIFLVCQNFSFKSIGNFPTFEKFLTSVEVVDNEGVVKRGCPIWGKKAGQRFRWPVIFSFI